MHLKLTWSDGSHSTIYVRKYQFDKARQQVHVVFDDLSRDICEAVIRVEETGPSLGHRLYADHVAARQNPPSYNQRKALREATLKVGRK